jgi:glycosyltransferase involved in cell wall biosynthesis
MKREFIRLFGLREDAIVVAPPSFDGKEDILTTTNASGQEEYSFLFASAPDSHKNFECICRAAEILKDQLKINDFKVYLTVKGDENKYTKWLFRKWGKRASNVEFIGYLDRTTLYEYYANCRSLIFPSKVEAWGLPITEFAAFNKPVLLADLPYTHETASGCNQVAFFDPENPQELAVQMKKLIQGDVSFLMTLGKNIIPSPVAWSWQEMFDILLR